MPHGDRSRSPLGDFTSASDASLGKGERGVDKATGGVDGDVAAQVSAAFDKEFVAKKQELIDTVSRGVQGSISDIVHNVVTTQLAGMDGSFGKLVKRSS